MKRLYIIIFLFLTGSFCFGSPQYGGILRLAAVSDPKTFNIITAQETSTTEAVGLLFEGLIRINAVTAIPEPALSTGWKHSENGLEWTFTLRKGVKWFDGAEFTADDVVFTFNKLIYNKDIPCSARDIFTLEGKRFKVEKTGKYKIKITTPLPYAPLLLSLSQPILPKHILEKSVKEGKFNEEWGVNTPPSEIIGTGPYKLAEYLPGQRLVYKRNKNYWKKGKPYIDRIVTYIVQNIDAQLLKFEAGEIDAVSVPGKDYALLKEGEKRGNYKVYDCGPAFGTNFIAFNMKRFEPARDLRFRQAAAYAIDRQAIIDNVMAGMAEPQYAAVSPAAGFFYNPGVKKYPYRPEKAKRLVKEIGSVKFTLLTNSENNIRVDMGTIIQSDLNAAGMSVSFRPIDFNNLVNKLNYTGDWDAVLLGFTGGVEPNSGKNVWSSGGHLHIWNLHPSSTSGWEKEIDSLFNKGAQELDREKRKKIYWKWQEIAAEELPLIYTVTPKALYAVNKRLQNTHPTAYGGALYNIEDIWIK